MPEWKRMWLWDVKDDILCWWRMKLRGWRNASWGTNRIWNRYLNLFHLFFTHTRHDVSDSLQSVIRVLGHVSRTHEIWFKLYSVLLDWVIAPPLMVCPFLCCLLFGYVADITAVRKCRCRLSWDANQSCGRPWSWLDWHGISLWSAPPFYVDLLSHCHCTVLANALCTIGF